MRWLTTLLPCILAVATAQRDRTACFNYIDCLEQAQRTFKSCAGGTSMALSLERRSRTMRNLLVGDRREILETCAGILKKESLDFDTLQTLVNEDSRECFQKIPEVSERALQTTCEYPVDPLRARGNPHVGCLMEFQQDRHRCERLLACCPEHNACAERMNALSIAYQLARKKSREIAEKMMTCINEETTKYREEAAIEATRTQEELKKEETDLRDAKASRNRKEVTGSSAIETPEESVDETGEVDVVTPFPTLSPTASEPLSDVVVVTRPTPLAPIRQPKYWVPNKVAHLHESIVGKSNGIEEDKEESTTGPAETTAAARRVRIYSKIIPSDGGMPFKKPDRAMRQRIQRRLKLTPSALLLKNREEFLDKFQKARLTAEEEEKGTEAAAAAIEEEIVEDEEGAENKREKKIAIVKFLMDGADSKTTERVITMLASGDIQGLEKMERAERLKRRKTAILRALPSEPASSEEEIAVTRAPRRASIENIIKQTLQRVSSDHRDAKQALMADIQKALTEQKLSMESLAESLVKEEAAAIAAQEDPITVAPVIEEQEETTTVEAVEREMKVLEKQEARLGEEIRARIGLEERLASSSTEAESSSLPPASPSPSEQISTEHENLKKVDIRPLFDAGSEIVTSTIAAIEAVKEEIGTTSTTTTTTEAPPLTTVSSPSTTSLPAEPSVERKLRKKHGKGARHARKSKISPSHEPTEGFCLSFGQCESIVHDYEERCDKKYNPITVTFGIEDAQLRAMLLNNSKSESSVVTQVCLRPVDKSVHNSVLQLQHIERGVRKACLSLGRDKATLEEKEKEECRVLAHFSVIEMEDWLEKTDGHTEDNLAECQARTAGIGASCQELASCCSAVNACEEYITASPVRQMRAEAISLLLHQQDDCEQRMERTLRKLHEHFRLRPNRW